MSDAPRQAPPPTIVLFTDTLGDVNGVSRFIQNIAHVAHARKGEGGFPLHVIASTRFPTPDLPNVHNLTPRFARAMPRYPQLELAWPPRRAMHALAASLNPSIVHVSTPGPVGLAGRAFAKKRGLPIAGVYHTDFPAYIDDLFRMRPCTWACRRSMRWFYKPFSLVFTRSQEYARAVEAIGVPIARQAHLQPGIDLTLFNQSRRREGVWAEVGLAGLASQSVVKVLYVGRVSVEKNLPLLTQAWTLARAQCVARGVDARLVVVGDGPYRSTMESAIAPAEPSSANAPAGAHGAHFLGFRHAEQLASLYASSDLFVFPSITDTLGQAVMEAQASGLPAIVSDIGGPKEIVRDGATGLIVNTQTSEAWADAVASLACDADARQRLGHAASETMRGSCIEKSFDDFIRQTLRVLGR